MLFCQLGRAQKFRFKNKLLSIDATTIELCASLFDWARFRRNKGAAKLHLVLDHDGYLPSVAVITDGKHVFMGFTPHLFCPIAACFPFQGT